MERKNMLCENELISTCFIQAPLRASWLNTPIGQMIAIATESSLCLLEFVDSRHLDREIDRLQVMTKSKILPGISPPILLIEQELKAYFSGTLKHFLTPIALIGSLFQKTAWNTLTAIPYGETESYRGQAIRMQKPGAFRAVALANSANQLAIIIPCHRIINVNGKLGGYGGGIERKAWLINHERQFKESESPLG